MSEYSLTGSEEEELQETQPAEYVELDKEGKRDKEHFEERLWGFLHPCSPLVERIDFLKPQTTYRLGRDRSKVDLVLNFPMISMCLCHSRMSRFNLLPH
jgi:hypothetical protein